MVAAAAGALPVIGARAAGKRYLIGLSTNGIGHPFSMRMMDGNKQYAVKHYSDVDMLITDGNSQSIKASVPLSEMFGYATDLRSMSQGRATFTMQFDRYDEVPQSIASDIVDSQSGS